MKFKKIRLRLATSEMIRKWARRYLPNGKIINGQILNSETINYQTLKPEKDGLFCERIFGPVNDYLCACGINSQRGHKFCPQCEVEYISSRVRRYRLGYIQFISAVAHTWFSKSNYFSLFLNLSKEKIDSLLYCTQNISRTIFPNELKPIPEGLTKVSKFFILPLPPPLPFKRKTKRKKKKKKNSKILLLRDIFASANLLSFNLEFRRFSKFWNFEKQEEHPIDYLLLNSQIQYNIQIQSFQKNKNKKSIWKNGGLKDSALFFGFSVISKMVSWEALFNWLSFVSFFIQFPQKKDRLNKFYPGPPGVVHLCKSQLFCLTGAQIIRTWLTQLIQYGFNDGKLLEMQIQLNLLKLENFEFSFELFLYKVYLYRRLKYLRSFRYTEINPASMVLSVFPVLPPDLRPIVTLSKNNKTIDEKDEIVVSDLNKLYQNVILRNKRLLYIIKFDSNFHCLNSETVQYSQRLLQESVDSLIENNEKKEHGSESDTTTEDTTTINSPNNSNAKKENAKNKITSKSDSAIHGEIHGKIDGEIIDDKIYHEIYHEIDNAIFNEIYNDNDAENDDTNKEMENNIASRYIKNKTTNNIDSDNTDTANIDNDDIDSADIEANMDSGKKDADLKSLSDLFKGKKGRFRQNLLGKRVDYSGRSVIVVGPSLKIYECGLPIEIAFELFQPFLLRRLMFKKYAKTIVGAKKVLNTKTKFIWNLLKDVVRSYPILLNRAPTLHRLSIQTFKPTLVDGKAILLHPLVCAAFNADFDGDQMGVHIPLCFQAQAEAWKINWSQNNLFSIATHAPTCSPSQDMILGSSFLTIRNLPGRWTKKVSFKFLKNLLFQKPFFSKTSKMFSTHIRDILLANIALICLSKKLPRISNKNFVWCNLNPYISGYETEKKVQKLIEIRLNSDGNFQKFRHELCQQYHFSGAEILRKIRTTYGQLKFYQNLI